MIENLKHLFQNQLLSGGLILSMVAGTIAICKSIPKKIYNYFHKKIISSIEIEDETEASTWLSKWLEESEYKDKFRNLTPDITHEDNGENIKIIFKPSNCCGIIKYKDKRIFIKCEKKEKLLDKLSVGYSSLITLSCFGKKDILSDLINFCYQRFYEENKNYIPLYNYANNCWWKKSRSRVIRDRKSLFFDDQLIEKLEVDLHKFLLSSERYHNLGIPWRRGYLYYGPPGNGKSSLVLYLAGKFKMGVYLFSLKSIKSDDDLYNMICEIPAKSIVLFEDIDSIDFSSKEEKEGITLSGLLNALDGPMLKEGVVTMMTCNNVDKLPKALIRCGRVDYKAYINNATTKQIYGILNHYFPDQNPDSDLLIEDYSMSMSQIQEICLSSLNIEDSIRKINDMIVEESKELMLEVA